MLYTSKSFGEIKTWLRENLTREKYCHSLGTMVCAAELAKMFNADVKKAETAGLLHDCAKNIPNEKMLEMVKTYNIDVYKNEINTPKILHAPLSAYIAKNEFGVQDEEILSAIRFHTIAKKEMSLLEKIIYIAADEYIEKSIDNYPNNVGDKYCIEVKKVQHRF